MHLNRFDLNLLVALDVLLHERNVTRAAERLFISQPAMSSALRKLREYLDDPLLVRVGRELELTARALALIEPVREAVLRAQAALGTRPVLDLATLRRTFVAVIPDFIVPSLVPPVLCQMMRASPGARLQIESASAGGTTRLLRGEIDFVVAAGSRRASGAANAADELRRAPLPPIRWVCAVAIDHPVVRSEMTREQFLTLSHIYVKPPGDSQSIDQLTRQQWQVDLDVRASTENVLEVPFLLAGTSLLAILPEHLACQLAGCLQIRVLEIPLGLMPSPRVELLWHRRDESDPVHGWMRELILRTSTTQRCSPAELAIFNRATRAADKEDLWTRHQCLV